MLLVWTAVHLSGLLLCRIDFERFVGLVSAVETHTKHLVLGLDLVIASVLGVVIAVGSRSKAEQSKAGLISVVLPLLIAGFLALGMIYFPAFLGAGQLPLDPYPWGKGVWPSIAYAVVVLTFLWLTRLTLAARERDDRKPPTT